MKPLKQQWRINSVVLHRFCIMVLIYSGCAAVNASETWQEAQAGQLYMRGSAHESWRQSVHLRSQVEATISGMVVDVEYKQTFLNSSNEWREAVYVFPLSEQAAVYFLSMTIGEREIIGQIKEKEDAQRIYQQAKKEGKKAALLDQQRPNLFTQKIANIAPGESISVTIKYVETAQYDGTQFSWRLPTTLTPRYMPGAVLASAQGTAREDTVTRIEEAAGAIQLPSDQTALLNELNFNNYGWALPTSQVADAHRISPPMGLSNPDKNNNPITLAITLAAGLPLANITAPYHTLSVSKQGDAHKVSLLNGTTEMDRDFVLQWRPTISRMPAAALFKQQYDGETFSMLMLMPPTAPVLKGMPREVTFILDTSGSMDGQSIAQAKAALVRAIGQLTEQDRFNVVEFNSRHRLLFAQLREANEQVRQQAIAWVNALQAGGGTEMLPALHAAFNSLDADNHALRQIVFITDGAVGNEVELFKAIHQQLGNSRLFTVGIGSAPNSYFMRKAAQFGRGTFTYIGAEHEVAGRMDELFRKLSSAVASNVQLSWPVAAEQFPQRVPDVYRGEPLLIFAKTPALSGNLEVSGEVAANSLASASQAWQESVNLRDLTSAHDSPGIARLWTRHKIEALEDQKVAGRDSAEVREAVLNLGLRHQLLTPYTSFVAVEQVVSRPVEAGLEAEPVANRMPKGQIAPRSGRSVAYPATATSREVSIWIGLLAIFAILAIGLQSRACEGRVRHEQA